MKQKLKIDFKVALISLFFLFFYLLTFSFSKEVITFSLYPLFYLFRDIVGYDIYSRYEYNILVPSNFDHHNFDIKPLVVKRAKDSEACFFVGTLEIEKQFLKILPSDRVVVFNKYFSDYKDPHIWVSVKNLKKVAKYMYEYLTNSSKFSNSISDFGYQLTIKKLDVLDKALEERFKTFKERRIGVYSYHNEFYYLGKDYNFEIKPLFINEEDISFRHIDTLINEMKKNRANLIILPPYYDQRVRDYINKKIDNAVFIQLNTNGHYMEYEKLLVRIIII